MDIVEVKVSIMKDKFNLTREQNVFIAKRNIVDYIWKSANLEGIAVTYPDTQVIFDGYSVQGYKIEEITAINNLKKAWQFILNDIDLELNLAYICKINGIVGEGIFYNSGMIRSTPVKIGGTTWQPTIPFESQIKEELDKVSGESNTERAINMMLYLMRKQIFLDGNKRTAMLIANKIMIENGCGIISIPIDKQPEFYKLLIKYYETSNKEEIKEYIYNYCIDGMTF